MIWRPYARLTVLAAACAVGSYVATYTLQARGSGRGGSGATAVAQGVSGWLDLTPQQAACVHELEGGFAEEREELEARLEAERERLAVLFEDLNASDEEILQQVENVIAAHDALERRVAAYLVSLRGQLTPAQQQRLFDRFASGVREAGGWRWQHGRPGHSEGERRGGGPPPGRGPRRGSGGPGGHARPKTPATTAPAPESQGVEP